MSISKALQRPGFWAALVVAGFLCQGVVSAQSMATREQEMRLTWEAERDVLDGMDTPDLARASSAIDRAFGLVQLNKLEASIWNWTTSNYNYTSIYCIDYIHGLAGAARSHDAYYLQHSPALGVPEGPWYATAQVHENTGYLLGEYLGEWEATDGARGAEFADPPLMVYSNPMMASTQFEESWPAQGWPAPENVVEVWTGTDTWNKWKRVEGGAEAWGTWNDEEAGERHPDGEASTLDLSGQSRLIGFSSLPTAFYQYEFTNNSTNTYTDVYLGVWARRRQQVSDGNESFPRWDYDRVFTYQVGTNYFTPLFGPGTHTDDDGDRAPWGGMVFLQTPTGSWKADAAGDTVDSPSAMITRAAFVDYSYRLVRGDHEWAQYGAMSGDLSYFDEYQLGEDVWKADKVGGGSPVLMQNEHTWAYYTYDSPDGNMTDVYTEDNRTFFQYFATGPFDWAPGEKLDLVYAITCGVTEQELLSNCDKTIRGFQAKFATSGPPPAPVLEVQAGTVAGPEGLDFDSRVHPYQINFVPSGPITLAWDGTAAESALDAITTNQDFQGYRIYKSIDAGETWGDAILNARGGRLGWVPVAQFDLNDGIQGIDPIMQIDIGSDSGLQHTWTDNNVIDGFEYWYALTTYDYDPSQDPNRPSYESALAASPQVPTVVAVIAGANPNGYVPGMAEQPAGSSTALALIPTSGPMNGAVVTAQILDERGLGAADYRLTITGSGDYANATTANAVGATLVNLTTGSTLYSSMLTESDLYGADLLPPLEGFKVLVDSKWNVASRSDVATPLWPEEITCNSGYEMLFPDEWSAFPSAIDPDDLTEAATDMFPARIDFSSTATQMAYVYTRTGYAYRSYHEFPGTAWDISDPDNPRQVNIAYSVNSSDATNGDDWDIDDNPTGNDSRHYTWILSSDYSGATADAFYTGNDIDSGNIDIVWQSIPGLTDTLATGETTIDRLDGLSATLDYMRPPLPGTEYEFSTTAPTFDEDLVDMDMIRVVPNPYRVFAEWDRSPIERKIQFINVPPNCNVEIYTLTGEFVASLEHGASYSSDSIGVVEWPLWSYEYTEVAYGLYLYVVKTFDGKFKKVGKFAIIR